MRGGSCFFNHPEISFFILCLFLSLKQRSLWQGLVVFSHTLFSLVIITFYCCWFSSYPLPHLKSLMLRELHPFFCTLFISSIFMAAKDGKNMGC